MLDRFKKLCAEQISAEDFAALGQPIGHVCLTFKVFRDLTARINQVARPIEAMAPKPTPVDYDALRAEIAQQVEKQTADAINAAVESRMEALRSELRAELLANAESAVNMKWRNFVRRF